MLDKEESYNGNALISMAMESRIDFHGWTEDSYGREQEGSGGKKAMDIVWVKRMKW